MQSNRKREVISGLELLRRYKPEPLRVLLDAMAKRGYTVEMAGK